MPPGELSAYADTTADIGTLPGRARYAFGAQFAEVRVDAAHRGGAGAAAARRVRGRPYRQPRAGQVAADRRA